MIKFNDYKKCFLNDEVIFKSQQRFISKNHDVYTENINKIALSSNDDKRIVHQIRFLAIHTDIRSKELGYAVKANKCCSNNKINKNAEDWWEYLDQIIPKGLVGVPRSNNT